MSRVAMLRAGLETIWTATAVWVKIGSVARLLANGPLLWLAILLASTIPASG